MLPVRSVLVDFDGTASKVDVTASLLATFGDPSWHTYDEAFARGDIGLREAIQAQDRMLDADRDTLIAFALEHGMLDPTFPPFVSWCEANDVDVAIVSDGFAFYIEPMMRTAGLGHVTVISNEQAWRDDRPDGLRFVNAHPSLRRVRHVQDAGGPAVSGAWTRRVRRRGTDGPLRRALRRRHVREARAGGVLRGGRRAVRRLGRLRRRPPSAGVDGRSARPRDADNSVPDGRRRNAPAWPDDTCAHRRRRRRRRRPGERVRDARRRVLDVGTGGPDRRLPPAGRGPSGRLGRRVRRRAPHRVGVLPPPSAAHGWTSIRKREAEGSGPGSGRGPRREAVDEGRLASVSRSTTG